MRAMKKPRVLLPLALAGVIIAVLFLSPLRQLWSTEPAKDVRTAGSSGQDDSGGLGARDLQIISVLGKDGIPAILEPRFLPAEAATSQMTPTELVLGLSIDGDHRAYPLNLLSRHEIVNDTVGGEPVAVTW